MYIPTAAHPTLLLSYSPVRANPPPHPIPPLSHSPVRVTPQPGGESDAEVGDDMLAELAPVGG